VLVVPDVLVDPVVLVGPDELVLVAPVELVLVASVVLVLVAADVVVLVAPAVLVVDDSDVDDDVPPMVAKNKRQLQQTFTIHLCFASEYW
jgi:hypothetical protein